MHVLNFIIKLLKYFYTRNNLHEESKNSKYTIKKQDISNDIFMGILSKEEELLFNREYDNIILYSIYLIHVVINGDSI